MNTDSLTHYQQVDCDSPSFLISVVERASYRIEGRAKSKVVGTTKRLGGDKATSVHLYEAAVGEYRKKYDQHGQKASVQQRWKSKYVSMLSSFDASNLRLRSLSFSLRGGGRAFNSLFLLCHAIQDLTFSPVITECRTHHPPASTVGFNRTVIRFEAIGGSTGRKMPARY